MTSALSFADASAMRAALAGNDEGPLVVIELRPPCPSERIEISGGFDGPDPIHVVKSLCRALECGPGALLAVEDPNARICGLSFAYVNVAASALVNRNWRPGQNRDCVDRECVSPAMGDREAAI